MANDVKHAGNDSDPAASSNSSKGSQFGDRMRFLAALLRSVTPTSRYVAKEMARPVNVASGLPVLELGPGTGPVTRAILERGLDPDKLYVVERSGQLCRHLEQAFPGVHVIEGDAFDLQTTLAATGQSMFDSVISGIPMLNFSQSTRNRLLNDALDRMEPGRPFVQITYGGKAPIASDDPSVRIQRSARLIRNLPPASVWLYARPQ